ncbi:MAG: signal peptide peptidase SppA [Myxococcota bacterium]
MRVVLGLLLNLLRLPLWPLWLLGRLLGRPRGEWVLFRVHARLVELARPRPFFLRYVPGLMKALPTPLEVLRRAADHLARDRKARGAVFVIPPLAAGWATCTALRDVLVGLRAAGKEVVVHLPRGGGNRELFVASAADRVLLGREAPIVALGLSIETRYLKALLDRVGLQVEAFARGEYKTAAERVVRDRMSDAQREQLGALLEAIDGELVRALAPRFGGDEARVREVFERGFLRGEAAVEAGLADGTAYEDELAAKLDRDGRPARIVRAPRYLAFREGTFFRPVLPRPYIAVVELTGAIAEQAPGVGGRGVDLDQTVRALRAARADRRAVGVVLHVDSPGGSATASDLIHREVLRLRERKPVVAVLGDVAASGGYYVAAPAHAIVAQPLTLTGSIGVVSARFMARELLDRIGVRTETLRTAPHADMFSPARALDDAERALIDRELDAFYQAFLQVVAEGRGRSVEEVDRVARGRVWAAADAAQRGLVDRMGGMREGLEEVRGRLRLPEVARRRIRPRLVSPPRGEPPTPEPPAPASSGPRAMVERLAPEVLTLVDLATGPDHVLYYATDLPSVR